MRLTPEQSRARRRDRIVEALRACGGGPLNKSTLRMAAFGGGLVDATDLDDDLRELENTGVIGSTWVRHWVGSGGSGCRIYWLVVIQRRSPKAASVDDMVPYLAPDDRVALLDLVHGALVCARETGESSVEQQRWLRISSTLVASELDSDESGDADSEGMA